MINCEVEIFNFTDWVSFNLPVIYTVIEMY